MRDGEGPSRPGEEAAFTTLPEGDVIVGDEAGDADLTPFADAVEKKLAPPYMAVAARQRGDLWAVVAKRIEIARIPFSEGDSLALARDEVTQFTVDGAPSDAPVPEELVEIGERAWRAFVVEATRIDGDFWDIRVTPL